MKRYFSPVKCFLCFSWISGVILIGCAEQNNVPYTVPDQPWPEYLGNHRAVLNIREKAEAVVVELTWRRHDRNPETKRFLFMEETTGDTIRNILRVEVNNETCKVVIGPVNHPGVYYFYYLPYEYMPDWGFYDKDYYPKENNPSDQWISVNHLDDPATFSRLPKAGPVAFQSRTTFDSFYPMEIIPLAEEKKNFLSGIETEYILFPENRAWPIRMRDEIPLKWIEQGIIKEFKGQACKNEYYSFQVGVYPVKQDLENIQVVFSDLTGSKNKIPAGKLTCFNTEGIGPYGDSFTKRLDVPVNTVQPLWIGVDIPESIKPGTYRGTLTVHPENAPAQTVGIVLKIKNEMLADRGDSEPWKHTRLRWLNSTLGIDDHPTQPYDPVRLLNNNTFLLANKKVTVGKEYMPHSITVGNTEILGGPISFVIESAAGAEKFQISGEPLVTKEKDGVFSAAWKSRSEDLLLTHSGSIESDGYIHYRVTIKVIKDIPLTDIRLEIPFRKETAQYMMGMGLPGTSVPVKHQSGWNWPHDSFWVGNTHGGLWCELRGGKYHIPLMRQYPPFFPPSWYNDGRGGFSIQKNVDATRVKVFSGSRDLKAGEEISFEWSMLITPVKEINYRNQFTDRYYHNGLNPMPAEDELANGIRIVNLHHGNPYNPNINYPFIAVDSMKGFVDHLQMKGLKVKIYYTIRELSNYASEIWALRSLGNEIIEPGPGGGYPWLREHLIDGYRPAWYTELPGQSADAAVITATGESRWYNYYIEGLNWVVNHTGIDGLYLDDVSYDRRTLKRIRKVLDKTKTGCLIDLHSHREFSGGPAIQYAEFFPFVDKLWFGESFLYDQMPPDNWLVEVSGIPFGLMGDMLEGGGNPWRGMVYGMTVRYPWFTQGINCDPLEIWKIWDQFGIANSVMKGYWEPDCPVNTGHPEILATAYMADGKTLVSMASWSEETRNIILTCNWKTLGLDPEEVFIKAPEIPGFQPGRTFRPGEPIPVEPGRGWLLIIE